MWQATFVHPLTNSLGSTWVTWYEVLFGQLLLHFLGELVCRRCLQGWHWGLAGQGAEKVVWLKGVNPTRSTIVTKPEAKCCWHVCLCTAVSVWYRGASGQETWGHVFFSGIKEWEVLLRCSFPSAPCSWRISVFHIQAQVTGLLFYHCLTCFSTCSDFAMEAGRCNGEHHWEKMFTENILFYFIFKERTLFLQSDVYSVAAYQLSVWIGFIIESVKPLSML